MLARTPLATINTDYTKLQRWQAASRDWQRWQAASRVTSKGNHSAPQMLPKDSRDSVQQVAPAPAEHAVECTQEKPSPDESVSSCSETVDLAGLLEMCNLGSPSSASADDEQASCKDKLQPQPSCLDVHGRHAAHLATPWAPCRWAPCLDSKVVPPCYSPRRPPRSPQLHPRSSRNSSARPRSLSLRAASSDSGGSNEDMARTIGSLRSRLAQVEKERAVALQRLEVKERQLQCAKKAMAVEFPQTWSDQHNMCDHALLSWWRAGSALLPVAAGSSEWNWVLGKLQESIPGAFLDRLERWEHRLQWREYQTRKGSLALKRCGNTEERWFWHGTGSTSPCTVLEHENGLDHRFAHGRGLYGRGLYLAERACYSNHTKYVHQSRNGARQLLLVRASLGLAFDFGNIVDGSTRGLTLPPEEEEGIRYDSVSGGPHRPGRSGPGHDDSRIFVLYQTAQAYPEYVVSYHEQ